MESPKELTIVIVNYNAKEYLGRCLESLQAHASNSDHQIVVIDNASDDRDFSDLEASFPAVNWVLNPTNRGFSKACNQGLSASPAQFYLLLNPDTEILDSAIERSLAFLKSRPGAGICGCRILNPDGSLQLASRRSIPRPSTALYRFLGLSRLFPRSPRLARYNMTYLDPEQSCRVEAVSGSFMLIRRDVLDQIGLLDEDFFLYGEDLDLCYRCLQAGWEVWYFAGAAIRHHKRRSSAHDPEASVRHFYEAMKIFYRKHLAGAANPLKNSLVYFSIDAMSLAARIRRSLLPGTGAGSRY